MAKPAASLKSTLNKSVMQKCRAHGRAINDLWLACRVKTNPGWALPNDRCSAYYLENNPHAATFGLAPEPKLSKND